MSFHQAVYPTIPEEETSEDGPPSNHRRVMIGAAAVLVTLGAITTISVCAAGKCKARRSTPTIDVQIPTSSPAPGASTFSPTITESPLPSDLPSDLPSRQPSLAPSFAPSSVLAWEPSFRPSLSTNTVLAGEEVGECSLVGCFLRNLETNDETMLSGEDTYSIDSSDESLYSIRCDTSGGVAYLDFITPESTVREWNAPFWMATNDAESTWVNPVAALSTCGDKSFRVAAYVPVGHANCIDQTFTLTALCEPRAVETKTLPGQLAALASNPTETTMVAPVAAEEECSIVTCHLLNIDSNEEMLLSGDDAYTLDATEPDSYSVGCSASEAIDYIDFSYKDQQHREWNEPFWMNSNSGDSWVEPSRQLGSCGDNSFRIVASQSSDGFLCSQSFKLTALC